MDDNIEYVVTIRCKHCGDIVSIELPKIYEKAQEIIKNFRDNHEHPNPWFT